jgi:hypothetical protein
MTLNVRLLSIFAAGKAGGNFSIWDFKVSIETFCMRSARSSCTPEIIEAKTEVIE